MTKRKAFEVTFQDEISWSSVNRQVKGYIHYYKIANKDQLARYWLAEGDLDVNSELLDEFDCLLREAPENISIRFGKTSTTDIQI